MRVLFFDDRHYAAQGAQRVLIQVAAIASDIGHDVTVASTRDGAMLEMARAEGLRTAVLGTPTELDQWGGMLSGSLFGRLRLVRPLIRQNRRIATLVRREKYDVVWAAAMRPMLSLAWTSFATRATVIWHVMSDAYFPVFNEIASLAARRVVLIADSLAPTVGGLYRAGLIHRKVSTIPAAVADADDRPDARAEVAQALGLGPESLEKTWITSLGGFVPEKGHLDVVKAVATLSIELQRQIQLLVGGPPGDDDYAAEVATAAALAKADAAILGWVDDVDGWMQASDIFVLASTREGMPLVLLEAMQRGAVPVSYDVGGVSELITHGTSGLVVEQGSLAGLAQAIETLVTARGQRSRIAEQALDSVRQHHTLDIMRSHVFKTLQTATRHTGAG